MEHQLPLAVVCRVLGAPRSSIYARRARASGCGRPGPATSISDTDVVELIRQVLEASPFAGEGYRKVRARLRREHGVQVSGKRVLRLLRREGLLAPQRVRGRRRPRPHDGTIIPDGAQPCAGAPTPPWPGPGPTAGCGCLSAWTTTPPRPGPTWPRSATASPPSSRSMTRSSTAGAGWMPTSPAVWRCATTGDPNTARPTSSARSPGWASADDAAFLGEPETNGCAERWIRTLKEQCLWAELHDTIDELRQAVTGFVDRYNTLVADPAARPPDPQGGLSGSSSDRSGMIN